MKKEKDLLKKARNQVLVLVLGLLVCFLAVDAVRSQGIFSFFSSKRVCSKARSCDRSEGAATSVVHVQPNFHVVAPGVWRSAQPDRESLKRMKSYGLKTIVNLRADGEAELWENETAKEYGIQMYHFPLSAKKGVPLKTVEAILSLVSDPARHPVLVHCASGKDRTGMILAAYRILQGGWSFNAIYQEMMMYGYANTAFPEMLETLRRWCLARGRAMEAQEIAQVEGPLAK